MAQASGAQVDRLRQIALALGSEGFPLTSGRVEFIAEGMAKGGQPADVKKDWADIVKTFRSEFVGEDKFRDRLFDQVMDLLEASAFRRRDKPRALLEQLEKQVNGLREALGNVQGFREALTSKGRVKQRTLSTALLYPLVVDTVFTDALRFLYALRAASKRKEVGLEEARSKSIRELRTELRRLGKCDAVFKGWEPRLVDAVSRGRFRYDEEARRIVARYEMGTGRRQTRQLTHGRVRRHLQRAQDLAALVVHLLTFFQVRDILLPPGA